MNLFYASISVLLLNLPFGYWRAMVPKMSLKWFLAIHIPIPFVVLLRLIFETGFELYTYPIVILAFFTGQYFGKKYKMFREKRVQN